MDNRNGGGRFANLDVAEVIIVVLLIFKGIVQAAS